MAKIFVFKEDMKIPDIQDASPEVKARLKKVGITGIRMPINSAMLGKYRGIITPIFDVYVDLPSDQRGIHASRNYEVINEVLKEFVGGHRQVSDDVCSLMAKELLRRHKYASTAEVKMSGEMLFEKSSPRIGAPMYETFDVTVGVVAKRGDSIKLSKRIRVEVMGITACPCAQEVLREMASQNLRSDLGLSDDTIKKILNHVPIATHMQRSYGSIEMEVPEGFDLDISSLIRIIEKSMSAPTFELLKRAEEAEVVKEAVDHPKFVEDCLRHMIKGVIESFPHFPSDTTVTLGMKNEESIHRHNLVASRSATLGDLRREVLRRT